MKVIIKTSVDTTIIIISLQQYAWCLNKTLIIYSSYHIFKKLHQPHSVSRMWIKALFLLVAFICMHISLIGFMCILISFPVEWKVVANYFVYLI